MISRTMHALEYDFVHDELVVNSPLNNAILTFAGGANGDVAPKRILGGPDTGFNFPSARGTGFPYIAIDPIRNLLVVSTGGALLIFDRTANGNTKPKYKIEGPNTQAGGGANNVPVRITE